ncbi:hypothetical protein ABW19_dt0202034 [Dactylella cylindrospora]|nr:hypothetical protein ABW19_dt0202034 [Dactylella cylindrospora]
MDRFAIRKVYIWKETPEALDVTPMISHVLPDLHRFLGIPDSRELGLFRIIPGQPREVFRNAPRASELGYQPLVGFADSYPIHLMSLSSYNDLDSKLKGGPLNLTISRFRANVIVTGLPPFDEDDWKYVKIGDFCYHVATRAVRCTLPNVDQITGARHKSEPDKMMNSYRRIDEGAPGHACFGTHRLQEVTYLRFVNPN